MTEKGKIACEVVKGCGHPATVTVALRDGRTVPSGLAHALRAVYRSNAELVGPAKRDRP